jgi:hypothetical protein
VPDALPDGVASLIVHGLFERSRCKGQLDAKTAASAYDAGEQLENTMRLITFRASDGATELGAVAADGRIAPISRAGLPTDMIELIARWGRS